jgi:hypothetical protein
MKKLSDGKLIIVLGCLIAVFFLSMLNINCDYINGPNTIKRVEVGK